MWQLKVFVERSLFIEIWHRLREPPQNPDIRKSDKYLMKNFRAIILILLNWQ